MAKSIRVFIAIIEDGKATDVVDMVQPWPLPVMTRVQVDGEWSLNLNSVPVLAFEPKHDVDDADV